MSSPLTVRVVAREEVAADVVRLRLRRADGTSLPAWAPGAHLDLRLAGDLVRQYSLCGERGGDWEIAVLRVPGGRGGSVAVHRDLAVGDEVEVDGPRNHFPLEEAESYLLVAGGIGITPLVPMVAELHARGAEWRLAYGGRSRASMAFADELVARFGDRVLIAPQDEVGLLDLPVVLGEQVPGRLVYCCGPAALLDAVEERMRDREDEGLRVERFTARAQSAPTSGAFLVRAERSGVEVEVAAGESIIDALERSGVSVEHSCREGTCGTCETTVLAGVPEHRDSVLSAEEQGRGDCVMVCVARCLEGPLVLDL
ncbi:PDR/VanB family oxidoreductase [Nocardioides sp. TRM66260-LWL]|uniref:PDR/VanB family oxidoreductase n=1 Tax=Nocardioides sp. TRM66260-LWL TaxID=2874478 RepID=UPI001CC4BB02|nr:PDR/VanB family oxidoreductase [Nocardioides sp. TRM66260-LWL]MBZ5735327.1 PDR/VanB family oxidoreductase [Nocardioides sp. TRM66260-LWL]